jgi:uncharacterized membrane protein YgaE (UPF0421/DUF939 family)
LRLQYPLYTLIAAVIVTDLSNSQTRPLGLQRLAGTLLGATPGAASSPLLHSGPRAIGLGILAAIFLSRLLRLQGAGKVAGYICGIAMLEHGVHP